MNQNFYSQDNNIFFYSQNLPQKHTQNRVATELIKTRSYDGQLAYLGIWQQYVYVIGYPVRQVGNSRREIYYS